MKEKESQTGPEESRVPDSPNDLIASGTAGCIFMSLLDSFKSECVRRIVCVRVGG